MAATSENPVVHQRASVDPSAFIREVRARLGLQPDCPTWLFSLLGAPQGPILVDAEGLMAWIAHGLELFRRPVPTMAAAKHVAKLAVVSAAMERFDGSISAVARCLATSRKAVRDVLKAGGRYPWARRFEGRAEAEVVVGGRDGTVEGSFARAR